MYRTIILLRLGCLLFGSTAGALLSSRVLRHFTLKTNAGSQKMLCIMFDVAKTVACCAAAVWMVPLPVYTVILYTGMGLVLTCAGVQPGRVWQQLPVICTWLILYLPVTGTLACLGGMLLVLAAGVPEMSGLAVLIVAAPMALLQFGAEGCLILISAAAVLCFRQVFAFWMVAQKMGSHLG